MEERNGDKFNLSGIGLNKQENPRSCMIGNALITVIVPIYNAAQYISDCLNGLQNQTYPYFELILVDDGSLDDSAALCEGFAEQDPRIRVIHQENGGVSKARNRGLDEAKGEYVVFVDADDVVKPEYLADLIVALQKNADKARDALIVADYQPFNDLGAEERCFPAPFMIDFGANEGLTADNFRELIFQFRLFPPYCKLYSRDVIEANGIRFREGMKSAEDFEFNIRYLEAVDRLVYIDSVQYEYRVGYKRYVPSNHGVLGESEIKSAHIMAHGISDLAKRMGICDEISTEIDLWAANKHYFNRLSMLFAKSDKVSVSQRKMLYYQLISDPVYYKSARRGAWRLPTSATKTVACFADRFQVWKLLYEHRNGERN